ncbi:hypothetical protein BC938DRAFT_478150 [Jimgerdemannia flammicorona]|uniref:Uncharacterized protein n=1 Tax=Jimgerdemannia flammicorona TaxID=994334 RepID=A0A433QNB8_9FUNG|nr:hypothetical protein BC938DRAFT_478150 [Jimgerdemannia flammicorona]
MDTTFNNATSHSSSISDTPDGYKTFGIYTPSDNTKYVLPSGDDVEIDRLDFQHYVVRYERDRMVGWV